MTPPPAAGDTAQTAPAPDRTGLLRKVLRPFHLLADHLAAGDPASSRLRFATRALIALAISTLVLFLVSRPFSPPMATYGMAILLSFIGSLAVQDIGWRAQGLTRLFAWIFGATAGTIAGALSPWPVAAEGVFLIVIFLSVYIRRYGQRWFAVGMVCFMSYFICDYLRAPLAQAGWLYFAAALALISSQIVTAHLLPDRPEEDFRRALRTMDHRINLILSHLLAARENGGLPEDDESTMRHHANRLRETVLMAEGLIPDISDRNRQGPGPGAPLAIALFDLQLAVERLLRARHQHLPPADALLALIEESGPDLTAEADLPGPHAAGQESFALHLLRQINATRARINRLLGPAPSPLFVQRPGPVPARPTPANTRYRIPETLHRPIQITFASGAAIAIGFAIDGNRWYWAVVTAYIVFNNTKTRADTAMRALHRSAGTLAGVIVGALIATLLRNHADLSMALLPPVFFLSFYFLQSSYGVMIFFLTIALAMLYGLIGTFTQELLLMRLAETVAGGLTGVCAAFFIFPVSTSVEVTTALNAFFDAFGKIAQRLRQGLSGPLPAQELITYSRALDRTYATLVQTARPLGGPWSAVTRFGHIREKLLLLLSCTHWARELSRALQSHGPISETEAARLLPLLDRIDRKLALAREVAPRWFRLSRGPDLSGAPMIPPTLPSQAEEEKLVTALEALDLLLTRALLFAGVDPRLPTD